MTIHLYMLLLISLHFFSNFLPCMRKPPHLSSSEQKCGKKWELNKNCDDCVRRVHIVRSMHQLIVSYAFVRSRMRQVRCFLHELFFVWWYCFAIKLSRSNLSFFRPRWARCIILSVFHFHRCRRACSMFYFMLSTWHTTHKAWYDS